MFAAREWPGVTAAVEDIGRRVLAAKRPTFFFSDKWPERASVRLVLPACLRALGEEEAYERLSAELELQEELAREYVRKNGWKVLGRVGAKNVSPYRCAKSWRELGKLVPHIAAGRGQKEARLAAIAELKRLPRRSSGGQAPVDGRRPRSRLPGRNVLDAGPSRRHRRRLLLSAGPIANQGLGARAPGPSCVRRRPPGVSIRSRCTRTRPGSARRRPWGRRWLCPRRLLTDVSIHPPLISKTNLGRVARFNRESRPGSWCSRADVRPSSASGCSNPFAVQGAPARSLVSEGERPPTTASPLALTPVSRQSLPLLQNGPWAGLLASRRS